MNSVRKIFYLGFGTFIFPDEIELHEVDEICDQLDAMKWGYV